jgi:hypothetical protein
MASRGRFGEIAGRNVAAFTSVPDILGGTTVESNIAFENVSSNANAIGRLTLMFYVRGQGNIPVQFRNVQLESVTKSNYDTQPPTTSDRTQRQEDNRRSGEGRPTSTRKIPNSRDIENEVRTWRRIIGILKGGRN